MKDFVIFDLEIGFLVKNCEYRPNFVNNAPISNIRLKQLKYRTTLLSKSSPGTTSEVTWLDLMRLQLTVTFNFEIINFNY